MDTQPIRKWFSNKVNNYNIIAEKYGEFEAELLLCCITSAYISKLWPGSRNIDKRRFIEFLIEYTPPETNIKTISIPVLIAKLTAAEKLEPAEKIKSKFYPDFPYNSQILTGSQIDKTENDILNTISISKEEIRKSSYAGIIYKDLRCGLVHEYSLPEYMSAWGMAANKNEPSYVNRLIIQDKEKVRKFAVQHKIDESEAQLALSETVKHLYIPYEYLRNVLTSAVNNLFSEWDSATSYEKPLPTQWWIEGK